MKKVALFLALWLVITNTQAQKKDLELGEAVLGQWRQFYPESLSSLQWVPNQQAYTFMKSSNDAYMIQSVKDKEAKKLYNKEELAEALGVELNYLPFMTWEEENIFTTSLKGVVYYVEIKEDKLQKKAAVKNPEGANLAFHKKTKQIAYTKGNNIYLQDKDGTELEIFASEDKNIVSGQAIARSEFGITKGIFWSADGSKLAFYQKDETHVTDYPLMNVNTIPATVTNIKYPMAGQASENAKVGIYDVANQKTIFLQVEGDKEQYLTNVGWGPEAKYVYVAIVNREQNHMWLNRYDANTGKLVKTLFEEKHPKYVEPEHPVWFLPNNKNEFLWQSERDGFNHLYRYNVEGELLNQVSTGKWVVLDILGLDAKGKDVLVKGTDESGLNTTLYCVQLDGKKPSKKMVKIEGQHEFDFSSDKKYILNNYSNLTTPNKVRLLDMKGKEKKLLLEAPNPYENSTVGTTEFKTLKAEDGTPLHTRLIKPANFDPNKKYPVIVYVYGGPHAQMVKNSWLGGASLWMHYAANQDYLVFTLDNRGSANRGLEFENCIHRQLSKLEMKDQMVGVDYLKTLAYADTDKMAIHGWSYGGFMTTSIMLKYPDVFKVGVAGGPVTDWQFYEIMYGERYMDKPEENVEGYTETRLANHADKLKGDLLLIHGVIDPVVVLQHNYTLLKAFVDNGVLVDYFAYPGHKHNVRGRDRIHLINKVLTYIDEKLKKD